MTECASCFHSICCTCANNDAYHMVYEGGEIARSCQQCAEEGEGSEGPGDDDSDHGDDGEYEGHDSGSAEADSTSVGEGSFVETESSSDMDYNSHLRGGDRGVAGDGSRRGRRGVTFIAVHGCGLSGRWGALRIEVVDMPTTRIRDLVWFASPQDQEHIRNFGYVAHLAGVGRAELPTGMIRQADLDETLQQAHIRDGDQLMAVISHVARHPEGQRDSDKRRREEDPSGDSQKEKRMDRRADRTAPAGSSKDRDQGAADAGDASSRGLRMTV